MIDTPDNNPNTSPVSGAAAEATVGAGIGANVLLGGTEGSIQLQPVSVEGQLGLNVAAAGATVTLHPVN